ncbi:hypothetical protein J1614_001260 [Plenodomus biglobosus]|nr:hypothetical protein J1614_001260 [Plenodomus biglobosus]
MANHCFSPWHVTTYEPTRSASLSVDGNGWTAWGSRDFYLAHQRASVERASTVGLSYFAHSADSTVLFLLHLLLIVPATALLPTPGDLPNRTLVSHCDRKRPACLTACGPAMMLAKAASPAAEPWKAKGPKRQAMMNGGEAG